MSAMNSITFAAAAESECYTATARPMRGPFRVLTRRRHWQSSSVRPSKKRLLARSENRIEANRRDLQLRKIERPRELVLSGSSWLGKVYQP